MATRRIGLNGSRIHIASVDENLNMSFPLLMTTKVCGGTTEYIDSVKKIKIFACTGSVRHRVGH